MGGLASNICMRETILRFTKHSSAGTSSDWLASQITSTAVLLLLVCVPTSARKCSKQVCTVKDSALISVKQSKMCLCVVLENIFSKS